MTFSIIYLICKEVYLLAKHIYHQNLMCILILTFNGIEQYRF